MPRKTAEQSLSADADAPTPRRSSRISSQPKPEKNEPVKKSTPRSKKGQKRSAEDETEQELEDDGTSKKVKIAENTTSVALVQQSEPVAESIQEVQTDEQESQELMKIDIGDQLPSFTLQNEKNEDVDVSSLVVEKGVILFLVPKADTPGCTTQACGFRDSYPDFTSLNYDVYCLSADLPTAQQKWQTKKSLPYPLLSDPDRRLISALGAGEGGKTKRSHFIFEKGGKLVNKKIPVKPADSPRQALEFIKSHSA